MPSGRIKHLPLPGQRRSERPSATGQHPDIELRQAALRGIVQDIGDIR
jgi:hypothetical protein